MDSCVGFLEHLVKQSAPTAINAAAVVSKSLRIMVDPFD
jgi:hypothetical protein